MMPHTLFQLRKYVGKWDLSKILIAGDSFAADWSIKYQDYMGWPGMLQRHFQIDNVAQAGCSEYRILKQLASRDLLEYRCIIVCHTSPDRVYTREHPVHSKDSLHHSSDLIYSDINYHAKKISGWLDAKLQSARAYFLYHYSEEYQNYVYEKIRNDIDIMSEKMPVIHVNNFAHTYHYHHDLDFVDTNRLYPGLINHLSPQGNWLVYQEILKFINDRID